MRRLGAIPALLLLWVVAGCAGSGTQIAFEEQYRGRIIGEPDPMFSDEPRMDFPRTGRIDAEWHLKDVGGSDVIVGWSLGSASEASWWERLGGMERSCMAFDPVVCIIWLSRDAAGSLRADHFAFLYYNAINYSRSPSGIEVDATGDEIGLRFSLSDVPGKSLEKPYPMKLEDGTPTGQLHVLDPTLVRLTGKAKVSRTKHPETPLENRLRDYAARLPDSELGKALARRLTGPKPIEVLLPFLEKTFAGAN